MISITAQKWHILLANIASPLKSTQANPNHNYLAFSRISSNSIYIDTFTSYELATCRFKKLKLKEIVFLSGRIIASEPVSKDTALGIAEGIELLAQSKLGRMNSTENKILRTLARGLEYLLFATLFGSFFGFILKKHLDAPKQEIDAALKYAERLKAPYMETSDKIALATKNLRAYCELYCPGISVQEASAMIKNGQALVQGILLGNRTQPSHDPQEAQRELAEINWFLTYCALQKKQGSRSWSLAIEEDSKLYNFIIQCPGVYKRSSSHYVGRSARTTGISSLLMESSSEHGVDVKNKLMPAEKGTVLFDRIESLEEGKKFLFFKPEYYGTQGWDLVMHALEFLKTQLQKTLISGSHDCMGLQREKVPDNTKKAFEALLQHIEKNKAVYGFEKSALKTVRNRAKLFGIGYMKSFIATLHHAHTKLNELSTAVENTWKSLDNLDKRTGREIYITAKELNSFASNDLNLSLQLVDAEE